MNIETPVSDLDSRFSTPDETPRPWKDAEQRLQEAGVYWLSPARPDGRPHVVPLIAVWLDGALYFSSALERSTSTGVSERWIVNL
jgi:hypothetical protein